MKKVLLLSPPSRTMNHYRPPLALMYVSGYLKKYGIDTGIIDITLKEQIRDASFYAHKDNFLSQIEAEIVRQVVSCDADIVGITCYTPELDEVSRLASKIKALKPGITIVVGGIHPTLFPHEFIARDSFFDFIVIGEGEVTFLDLVRAIRSKAADFSRINGIGFYDTKANRPLITQKRELAADLDQISYPDYGGIDMNFYTTPSPYAIRGVFTKSFYISSSRGCPSSCTFCVSKQLREFHGVQRFVRLRSAQSLFSEIKHLRDTYGIDSFYFIDDLFTLKKDNVHQFCDLMKRNALPMIWGCSSKVSTVNFELLKAMKQAGCVQIDFGVERGSDRSLELLKKGITIAQIKQAFKDCASLGIRTFANMLVNAPQETKEDLEDILKLVEDIKPTVVSFNIFTPYPGCEIYNSVADKITPAMYSLLMEPADKLISRMPEVFKFASHSIAFDKWVALAMKKYNKILPNIKVYWTPQYWRSFTGSKRKFEYVLQFRDLVREFMSQKF